jgi:hypothetical protein
MPGLGPNGFFTTLPNPEVNEAGSYTVTVTAANGCTGTDVAEVVADQDTLLVEAQGGTLTCSQLHITLSGVTGSIFEWTGPDGFYSQEPNPVVEKTGIYILTVTAMNGCEGTATAEVTADLNAPSASAIADTLDCTNISANLYGTSDVPGASFHWTGPNGFESDLQNPQAGQAGVYLLTVTNPANGCTAQTQTEMVAVLDVPGINVIQLPPHCGDSLLLLDASSPLPGAMFSWTGPNGFTAQTEDVQVTVADWYRVKAVAPNGCSSEIQILAVPRATHSAGEYFSTNAGTDLFDPCHYLVGICGHSRLYVRLVVPGRSEYSATGYLPGNGYQPRRLYRNGSGDGRSGYCSAGTQRARRRTHLRPADHLYLRYLGHTRRRDHLVWQRFPDNPKPGACFRAGHVHRRSHGAERLHEFCHGDRGG